MRQTLNFFLYSWLRVENLLTRDRFSDHSRATFDAVFDTSERIAREKFAPFNRLVDTEEPRFDGTSVHMPSATKDAVDAYVGAGLLAAGHDYDVGGMQLPYVVDMAANTFFSIASIGLSAYGMLSYANCNLLVAYGTPQQRNAFAQPIMDGRSLGTMCLSEPQAGSSLGDIVTKATPDGQNFERDALGPRYRLKGNKMWISGGEHELSDNIIHLVLAKIPDENGQLPYGVGGLSLFVVPRKMVGPDGTVSNVRNDVSLAGLNHKLGYRATVNTLLNFGEGRHPVRTDGEKAEPGAVCYRIGEPGYGLSYMFHMMNEARINVGMGATMVGYAGYIESLRYARDRTQGRIQKDGVKDQVGRPNRIVEHADVKRMLLAQKAYVEGGLALGLYCARLVDDTRTGSEKVEADALKLLGILTPIAKSWPSEWGLEANNLAIQILGGYGYTRDFPVEQFWRDNRLNMIHEGTHGIQGIDLLSRKVRMDNGQALEVLSDRIRASIVDARTVPNFESLANALEEAHLTLVAATRCAIQLSQPRLVVNATAYLQAFGHIVIAWMWLEIAITAQRSMEGGGSFSEDFYRGKLQAARYFFRHELPKARPLLALVSASDTTALDMQDAWF